MSEFQNSESRLVELKKLGELKEAGLLSDEEFEAEKNRLLNATVQTSESEMYKAGSHESKPATARTKSGRNPILSFILFAWLCLVFLNPAGLVLLGLIEIVLFFVSKKREKKFVLTLWIISLVYRKKSQIDK